VLAYAQMAERLWARSADLRAKFFQDKDAFLRAVRREGIEQFLGGGPAA